MKAMIQTRVALRKKDIITMLGRLRQNALIESSHFAVAAVLEWQLPNDQLVYVGGVNVEHTEHNRLSMHAEQNALVTAMGLFGRQALLSKIWIMGAPEGIEPGSNHPLAEHFVLPCGHCRQILINFTAPNTTLFSVSVNGTITNPMHLEDLLPQAFSERDLYTEPALLTHTNSHAPCLSILQEQGDLSDEAIIEAQNHLFPHIIDPQFITTPIRTCIVKIRTAHGSAYYPGALMQDIAFLTTDAVFASLGFAISEQGHQALKIDCVYLSGNGELSGCELTQLMRFSTKNTVLKFYDNNQLCRVYQLPEYIEWHTGQLRLNASG